VEKKKTKGKPSALWAFLFGIILMLGVYILFESAPNRLRLGSTDDTTDTTTDIVKTTNIVQTAAVEYVSVRPSVFFGVEVLSVNSIIAEQLSLPGERGVLVNGVVDGSPAKAAGLQRGDAILSLDSKAVKDIDSFRQLLAAYNPGDNVRIAYIRNAQKDTVYAQLVGLPEKSGTAKDADSSDTDWGVSLSDISSAMRNSLNIPADIGGVAILSVTPGGAADKAGLQPTDVITGIDRTPVSSMDDFFRMFTAGARYVMYRWIHRAFWKLLIKRKLKQRFGRKYSQYSQVECHLATTMTMMKGQRVVNSPMMMSSLQQEIILLSTGPQLFREMKIQVEHQIGHLGHQVVPATARV